MKIMVVDDDETQRQFCTKELEKSGYEVLATSSDKGMGLFMRENPNLVILFINMPQRNARIELLNQMKNYRRVPIILLADFVYGGDFALWSADAIVAATDLAELQRIIPKCLYKRIEDFITLAKGSKDVNLLISLRKVEVSQKEPAPADMYLLIADYKFTFEGNEYQFQKPYLYARTAESPNDANLNRNVANERLRMDYKRLREANIRFDEVFFETPRY